jgi:2-hydroxy-3-keto-5-methylthiopentenyl-1-phosphate phosphatase
VETPPSPLAPRVATVLVDFDGTASPLDGFVELCRRFVGDDWERHFERASWKGNATQRADMARLARLLRAPRAELLAFALDHIALDPGFAPFVDWARGTGITVAVVSDGLGFYVEPLLAAAGLADVPVLTNVLVQDAGGLSLRHPHEHPTCRGCGTCKMQAVLDHRARGPVAFVGDGVSDRYAALYADRVFAKDSLARICADQGLSCEGWATFADVRAALAERRPHVGHTDPAVCPGWTLDEEPV